MRPSVLNRLFSPTTELSGIGPKISKLIENIAGPNILDLMWHLPTGIVDRTYSPLICNAENGKIATVVVQIEKHIAGPKNRRLPYKIICSDDSGTMTLVYFNARRDYLERVFPLGEIRVVSGTLEKYDGKLQISHPDIIGRIDTLDTIKAILPIYPLTRGLSQNVIAKGIKAGLNKIPKLDEWLDHDLIQREKWPSWDEAIKRVHNPKHTDDLNPNSRARQRLAYDQILANQLAITLVRKQLVKRKGKAIVDRKSLYEKIHKNLPFSLTRSQNAAVSDIHRDLTSNNRMHRLLQGDVGSGKTVVAVLGLAPMIEAGMQVAFLAPTEILARQHFTNIKAILEGADISITIYTGQDKGQDRKVKIQEISSGKGQIVIGTHTIFQESVTFKNLGMAIIDEQHRFGVHQRLSFVEKGRSVDLLVMTATPIPRTLHLTVYGDMDISQITEKPKGRMPIDTRVMSVDRLDEVFNAIGRALENGSKIFWICPLIEDSEKIDLAAAKKRFQILQKRFGNSVGLIHGKMNNSDKIKIMDSFTTSITNILVSTTVIEVGIDVPSADIIVIEHAERFGLAQLHQLRGRVGRGKRKSSCLLVYSKPITDNARQRLNIMRETQDGFVIAEKDLRIRGSGDLLGTRQSGLPNFKLVDFSEHKRLLSIAKDDVKLVLNSDPDLKTKRGQNLRTLLYVFEKDLGVNLLKKS